MKDNERLVAALSESIRMCPEVELAKFIHYISANDDLSYTEDDDLSVQIEHYNSRAEETSRDMLWRDLYNYKIEPNTKDYIMDELQCDHNCTFYNFTKENEQIAYERYKASIEDRVFFDLVQIVNMKSFLESFQLDFVKAEDYQDIMIINHRDSFLNDFPLSYRHMNGYVVARKGDKYIAKHVYLVKIPCFGELMDYAMQECKDEYDECLVIALDWNESPRFTDYTRHIMFGMEYRKKDKIVEIYNEHQTIEKFHEFFQKANRIISNWRGVLYDDGTCELN